MASDASRAKTMTWPARLLWWLGSTVVCLGLGAAGFATGAVAAWLREAPPVDALEWYDPPQMTEVLDRSGQPFARLFEEQRRVVPIRDVPRPLVEAFLATEDANFYNHVGIDPRGLARAIVVNIQRGRMAQGASTITQQAPRNLLPSVGRERTLERKLREAIVALQLERHYSKDQILEVYLNQIYLGAGTHGIEAASQRYFGKPVGRLDRAEMALLAGLPQLPERYSPANSPERARERRDQVLGRLATMGWIEGADLEAALAAPVTVTGRPGGAPDWARYFLDVAERELALRGDDANLRRAGVRLRTTMDSRLQQAATDALEEGLAAQERAWLDARHGRWVEARADTRPPATGEPRMARVVRAFDHSLVVELPGRWRADLPIPEGMDAYFAGLTTGDGVDVLVESLDSARRLWRGRLLPDGPLQGALVCLDARSGEVLALVGGRKWSDEASDGFFNRALDARRQAGSTLKPLVFAAALEAGSTPWSTLLDEPLHFPNGYSPRNYDGRFVGSVSLQRSLEESRNVPTIRLAQQVGLRRMAAHLARFDRALGGGHWDLRPEAPMVLGAVGVTPLELAAAWQPLANAGVAAGPRAVLAVEGGSPGAPPRGERLLSPQAAAWMQQMLVGVMTHGTGASTRALLPARLHDAVAGKTGTTNDNRDAWFAGHTSDHVVVVWVGFDQWMALAPTQTGGRAAGPIWAGFVARAGGSGRMPRLPEGHAWALVDLRDGGSSPEATAGEHAAWRAVTGSDARALASGE